MKFYTLGLIIAISINAHGCKHAQLLPGHKYLPIELQVRVPAGQEMLSILLRTFPKKFAR